MGPSAETFQRGRHSARRRCCCCLSTRPPPPPGHRAAREKWAPPLPSRPQRAAPSRRRRRDPPHRCERVLPVCARARAGQKFRSNSGRAQRQQRRRRRLPGPSRAVPACLPSADVSRISCTKSSRRMRSGAGASVAQAQTAAQFETLARQPARLPAARAGPSAAHRKWGPAEAGKFCLSCVCCAPPTGAGAARAQTRCLWARADFPLRRRCPTWASHEE